MFKPMLADDCTNPARLSYPILASTKLDGIRATMQDGILKTRSLKPIPNVNVQARFKGLPEGLDGELICGEPTDPECYRRSESVCMSKNKPAYEVTFRVFDRFGVLGFRSRLADAATQVDASANPHVMIVQHVQINSAAELALLEEAWLELGHEGVMIRSITGPYKQGRSTENEGYLLKLKQFADAEAIVVGAYEKERNENPATINALGHTERSSHKAGKVGDDTLGGFYVRGQGGTYDGVEFKVGGGFTAAMRQDFWFRKNEFTGQLLKFKYFVTGSKDKPRFPVFKGWRSALDL